jgi:Flp pilus assembly protein TadG
MPNRWRRGTNAIEFAITFPFFVFVMAGMIDAAWMVMQQSAYDSAAHLGCRDGSTKDPGFALANIASVKSYAQTQALYHLGQYGGQCNSCSVTAETLYSNPAMSLRCTITGAYKPLFGVLPNGTLKSKAVVRMEFQR